MPPKNSVVRARDRARPSFSRSILAFGAPALTAGRRPGLRWRELGFGLICEGRLHAGFAVRWPAHGLGGLDAVLGKALRGIDRDRYVLATKVGRYGDQFFGFSVGAVTRSLRGSLARNAAILDRIPAGRWADPEDFAGAAVFLASRASDYVHGAIVPVDGGWLGR